jgi:hypothetical protein
VTTQSTTHALADMLAGKMAQAVDNGATPVQALHAVRDLFANEMTRRTTVDAVSFEYPQ